MMEAMMWAATLAAAPVSAQVPSPQPSPPDSPTNATATPSPSTVAAAFAAPDDTARNLDISLGTAIAGVDFGGATRSRIISTALGVRYATGGLRLSASIPYMNIRTTGTILTGIDSTPVLVSGTTTSRRITYHGLGDLTLGAAYTLPLATSNFDVEVSGRIKLPTARDSSGLSSGKTDYSAGLQLTRTIGRLAPFVSATCRIFGDNNRFRLRDGLAASVGASFVASNTLVLLGSYHYAARVTRLVRDSHELFAGGSIVLPGKRLRLTTFVTKGLSNGAADISGGLGISLNL